MTYEVSVQPVPDRPGFWRAVIINPSDNGRIILRSYEHRRSPDQALAYGMELAAEYSPPRPSTDDWLFDSRARRTQYHAC